MNGKINQQVIGPSANHEINFRQPKPLDFLRARELSMPARSKSPKIVHSIARSSPDTAVKRGKWTLYFLCKHCDTEWLRRSYTAEAISQCPVCSSYMAPYERE